jgi:N-acetylneuraminate lyase
LKDKLWIEGIVPAVFTPMQPDGSLNLGRVPAIVEFLIQEKVSALYVCGSTGEGPSLTSEERRLVAEAYIRAAADRLPVIVQIGHNSLKQARALAAHAQQIGAAAISAVPPSYFKIYSLDQLICCLEEIADGAPELPFYYYHIPRLTDAEIDLVEFLRIGSDRLPTLNGVKYSNFKIFELQACTALEEGRFNMLFGSDEMLLSGLVGGAQGAVGSTYNFAASLHRSIFAAYRRGDIVKAQHLQGQSVEMIQPLNRFGSPTSNLPAFKALMQIIGLDCGPIRLPHITLSAEQSENLRSAMEAIGFFEWGCDYDIPIQST